MYIKRELGLPRSTILTQRGPFDFAKPNASDINLGELLFALSKTCRYGGFVPRFYSVAEHSVLALRIADILHPDLHHQHRWAVLTHDFPEVLTGDLLGPWKRYLCETIPEFRGKVLEIEGVVDEALHVSPGLRGFVVEKEADAAAYYLERLHIFGWDDVQDLPHALSEIPASELPIGLPPEEALLKLVLAVAEVGTNAGHGPLVKDAWQIIRQRAWRVSEAKR